MAQHWTEIRWVSGSVLDGTQQAGYRQDSDQIADWLDERTEGGGFTLTDELILDYTRFAGLRTRPTRVAFVECLKNKNIKQCRKSYGRGFEITLKPNKVDD